MYRQLRCRRLAILRMRSSPRAASFLFRSRKSASVTSAAELCCVLPLLLLLLLLRIDLKVEVEMEVEAGLLSRSVSSSTVRIGMPCMNVSTRISGCDGSSAGAERDESAGGLTAGTAAIEDIADIGEGKITRSAHS